MIRIRVTQQDIDAATPGHSQKCPIAQAFRRTIRTAVVATVNYNGTWIDDADGFQRRFAYDDPEFVVDRIKRFDKRQGVEPFEFDVEYDPKG